MPAPVPKAKKQEPTKVTPRVGPSIVKARQPVLKADVEAANAHAEAPLAVDTVLAVTPPHLTMEHDRRTPPTVPKVHLVSKKRPSPCPITTNASQARSSSPPPFNIAPDIDGVSWAADEPILNPPPVMSQPPSKKSRSSSNDVSFYQFCLPPGLDEHTFNLVSRMAPTVANVMRWVRPAEVLGDIPAEWPHPDPPVSVLVSSTSGRIKSAGSAAPVRLKTQQGTKGVAKTPRTPKTPGVQRVVPSARCARCALKKKKCTRVLGGVCVACSKWANKAQSEDEMQRRMQSCKVPLVFNQRGGQSSARSTPSTSGARSGSSGAHSKATSHSHEPIARQTPLKQQPPNQTHFFPSIAPISRLNSSPTSTIASAHSTPRGQPNTPSPPFMDTQLPIEAALSGITDMIPSTPGLAISVT